MAEKPLIENKKVSIEGVGDIDFHACMSRRAFLLSGATVVACTVVLPGLGGSNAVAALEKEYPRKLVGNLSQLKEGVESLFYYPDDTTANILVKLGVKAGGGIGKHEDIVAFNSFCTHMGGPMNGFYKHEHKVVGPCPFHLTTFDLTRFGIVVAGHATESLPQVLLTAEGDEIYATGFRGLIYGKNTNL